MLLQWLSQYRQQRGAVRKKATRPSKVVMPWQLLGRVGIVVCLSLGVALVWRYSSVAFAKPIERVAIVGDLTQVDKSRLIEQLQPLLVGGFMGLTLSDVQEALEQNPWVDSVRVERVWPHTLRVFIQEQKPIAIWNDEAYLNHRGELFQPTTFVQRLVLPRLQGPVSEAQNVMVNYRALNALLREQNLQLERLAVNERGAWVAFLQNDIKIVLGQQQIMEKMRRFTKVYRRELAGVFNEVSRIDMRYHNGVAVAWKEHVNGKGRITLKEKKLMKNSDNNRRSDV